MDLFKIRREREIYIKREREREKHRVSTYFKLDTFFKSGCLSSNYARKNTPEAFSTFDVYTWLKQIKLYMNVAKISVLIYPIRLGAFEWVEVHNVC